MRDLHPWPRRQIRSSVAAALAVMLGLACTGVSARPEAEKADRIGRFLADKALTTPAPASTIAPAIPAPLLTPALGAAIDASMPSGTSARANIAERVRD